MDKYIYDKENRLQYELHEDYYLPCLAVPERDGEPMPSAPVKRFFVLFHIIPQDFILFHR